VTAEAPAEAGRPGPPDEQHDADAAGPPADTATRGRQIRMAVVGIAVLIGLGVLARQTIDDDHPSGGAGRGAVPDAEAAQTPRAPPEGAPGLPRSPGAFDGFGRRGQDELGVSDSGRAWLDAQGTWGVEGGQARLVAPEKGRFRSLAVIELDARDVTVEVTATAVRTGCGLVFRYKNPLNYWFVTAVPELATWTVGYVEDGSLVDVGNLGMASTDPGTVIGVRLGATRIEAFVDGTPVAAFDDPTLAGETRAGLVAGGNTPAGARWDNFVATAVASPPGGG